MFISTDKYGKVVSNQNTFDAKAMLAVTVILTLWLCCAQSATLPSSFKRCKPKDADFNECLKDSVQDALHQLASGLPSLNVPPIDPLFIPSITISTGTPSVNIVQSYTNFTSIGFKNSILEDVNADLDKDFIELRMLIPKFVIEAQYDLSGRVLVLPLQGKGPCSIICGETKGACAMKTKKYTKKGKKHIRVEDVHCSLITSDIKLHFENLFGGDKRLSDAFNNIIENNSKEIFKDVGQSYADTYGVVAKDFANRIFSKVPMEEIFPSE